MKRFGAHSEIKRLKRCFIGPRILRGYYEVYHKFLFPEVAEAIRKGEFIFEELVKNMDAIHSALKDEGVELVQIKPSEGGRNQWPRDNVMVFDKGAIICRDRTHIPFRVCERWPVMEACVEERIPILLSIHGKGYFSGGGAVWIDDTLCVGIGSCLNMEGVNQVKFVLPEINIMSINLPQPAFHLDFAFGVASEEIACGDPRVLPNELFALLKEKGINFIPFAEEEMKASWKTANIVAVRPGRVIQALNPSANKKLEKEGIDVIVVDLGKLSGGPHCATSPILRE